MNLEEAKKIATNPPTLYETRDYPQSNYPKLISALSALLVYSQCLEAQLKEIKGGL